MKLKSIRKLLGAATLLALLFNFSLIRVSAAETPTVNASISSASPAPIQLAAGSSGAVFAVIRLTNPQSVAVTNISGLQIISDQDINTLLSSIRLYDGTAQLGASVTSLSASGGNYSQIVSVSNLTIPGYSYKDIKIVADVGGTPNRSVYLRLGLGGASFLGNSYTSGFPVYGNSMGVSTTATTNSSLTLSLYPESPLPSTWKGGDAGVTFTKIKMTTDNSSVSTSSITIQADTDPSGLLSNLKLYDGALLIATAGAEFEYSNSIYSKTIPASLSIAANSFKLITISADILTTLNRNVSLRLGIGGISSTAGSLKGAPSYGYSMTLVPKSPMSLVYSDGDVIQDGNTIYVIEYGKKRGLVSMDAFNRLGYTSRNITKSDTTGIPTGDSILATPQRHARGSLVVDRGTIYFLGKDVRYPFPSAEVFLSWGNRFEKVVPANTYDIAMLIGPVVQLKGN